MLIFIFSHNLYGYMVEFYYLCKDMKLTLKQEKFCNYYLECGNASEAYRRAYSCERMKDKQIWEESCKLLSRPNVAQRIGQLRAGMEQRSNFTKDNAVSILRDIATANVTDVLVVNQGKNYTTILVKDLSVLPMNVQRAIASVKSSEKGFEIKLYSKIEAIERLSKLLGWDEPVRSDIKADVGGGLTINHTYTGHIPATSEDEVKAREKKGGANG